MDHTDMDHASMDHGAMGHAGHGDHVGQFRRLFWLMLVLAVPVVAFSGMFAMLLGYELPDAAWAAWISPVLGTVMYVWGGRPFLTGAVAELRQRSPGMMLLIALAITVAPIALPTSMPVRPEPPPAPWTSSTSPGCRSAFHFSAP